MFVFEPFSEHVGKVFLHITIMIETGMHHVIKPCSSVASN